MNMNGGQQQSAASQELPPNFKPCSLKGRPFTPTFDTSCHNNRGIDVWANHAPRGWQATGKTSTLPRNLGQARAGGQLPPAPAAVVEQKQSVSQKQEVVKTSSQSQVVSSQQVVTQETSTIQQSSSSSSTTNAVSSQQESATVTQDEVDKAAAEAQMAKEQAELEALRVEEEKRALEQKMMEEEQARLEQEQREKEIAEQKRIEEEQRQREIEEQRQREEEERARKEQELREQQEREQRERELKEQQQREEQERLAREQQEREQREQQERMMREQQEREQREQQERMLREQQEREQREQQERMLREQQEREQQERMFREQQAREQQMQMQQQQQMMQQQQSMTTTSSTTKTSFQEQTSTLHKSEISMQMKSGGMMSGGQGQQFEDYTGSLRPTTTGSIIRQTGDVIFTQAGGVEEQAGLEQVELRPVSKGNVKDNIRQSGVFVGIIGDNNSLVNEFGDEKHSVKELVGHFSKVKGSAPQQWIPQHLQVQNNAGTPSLSQLQDQAKSKQFAYQQQSTTTTTSEVDGKLTQEAAEEKLANLPERKNSLKSFLLMEEEMKKLNGIGGQILDPSAILQVDGSLTEEISAVRGPSRGRELDSQGGLIDTGKWDNHNAIASGYKGVKANYRPVTFRKIYGVNKQAPTPTPTAPRAAPAPAAQPPAEEPQELQPDCSDL